MAARRNSASRSAPSSCTSVRTNCSIPSPAHSMRVKLHERAPPWRRRQRWGRWWVRTESSSWIAAVSSMSRSTCCVKPARARRALEISSARMPAHAANDGRCGDAEATSCTPGQALRPLPGLRPHSRVRGWCHWLCTGCRSRPWAATGPLDGRWALMGGADSVATAAS